MRTLLHHDVRRRRSGGCFAIAEQPNFPPRYNVAPTQPVPIVRMVEGERQFALVRWGLIPAWVKDPKGFTLLINARGESVNDKPAFRNAMKRRRCLFPADGFYEWKTDGRRASVPISRGRRPAGRSPSPACGKPGPGRTARRWRPPRSSPPQANRAMATVHHRAPVIVPPEAFDFWLDCSNVDEKTAAALIAPAPEGSMEVYEMSPAVNRVANDSPN